MLSIFLHVIGAVFAFLLFLKIFYIEEDMLDEEGLSLSEAVIVFMTCLVGSWILVISLILYCLFIKGCDIIIWKNK